MSRPTIDVQATLKKLQTSCEDKIKKLDILHQEIAQKEAKVKEISNVTQENLSLAKLVYESASLQLELAKLMVEVEKENKVAEEQTQLINRWTQDKTDTVASASYLLNYFEIETAQLQAYHNSFQDAYRCRKESNLMMKEDYLALVRDKVEGIPQTTQQKRLFKQLREELKNLERDNLEKYGELTKLKEQEQEQYRRVKSRKK